MWSRMDKGSKYSSINIIKIVGVNFWEGNVVINSRLSQIT